MVASIALAMLLVFAGTVSVSHGSDHLSVHEDNLCSVCLHGDRLDALPESLLFITAGQTVAAANVELQAPSHRQTPRTTPYPRGPPTT